MLIWEYVNKKIGSGMDGAPPVQKYPAVTARCFGALRNRLLKVNRTEAGKSTSGIGSGWELLNVNVRLSVDGD
jgi:hypothetical protein